jgi:uncharacterized protein YuzE
MKITYSPTADAAYIYFSNEKGKKLRTEKLNDNVFLDYNGKVLFGIEILDASKIFGSKPVVDFEVEKGQSVRINLPKVSSKGRASRKLASA